MHGAIAWFARNHVAANLLLITIVALGLFSMQQRVPLEVFPDIALDKINISVSHRGATPEDSEQSLSIPIEEAIADLEGIKKISSRSTEGRAQVTVDVANGYDVRELMNDIKGRVDSLNTLPSDAERPRIEVLQRKREVISVVVVANATSTDPAQQDVDELQLRKLAEQTRDDLLRLPGITLVELEAARPYEISIEVDELTLREYELSLAELAQRLSSNSLDLSAGSLKSSSGELLLRTRGQAYSQADFEALAVGSTPEGAQLHLRDVARVLDGFDEQPIITQYNNRPAMVMEVYRSGDQSAIEVAKKVKVFIDEANARLPEGFELQYWRDRSKIVQARLQTLSQSAIQGGILVIILLSLFLRPQLAFWVCIGIPVSFLGSFILMPALGVTLNIVSLFAFILVLGIVVDDAIVTGENVYRHLQNHDDPLQAAIIGTQEVSVPVTFGVLTTVAAFLPLLFIEGTRGAIFSQISMIVIPVLLFSLIESKLVLPAHLKNLRSHKLQQDGRFNILQKGIADGLESAIKRFYSPLLAYSLHNKRVVISVMSGIAIIVFAAVASGWTKFIFFPRIQSETARATLTMPAGTHFDVTHEHIEKMTLAAQTLQKRYVEEDGTPIITHILSTTGSTGRGNGSHLGRVKFEILAPEQRISMVTSSQLVKEWRKLIGDIPGMESLSLRAEIGHGGEPIDIQLSGDDYAQMRSLIADLKGKLHDYPELFDISDSLSNGKEELRLALKPQAQRLGLNLNDLARQVRSAFFGYEVQRIQRGREDVRVMLRYPADKRSSVHSLENMMVRTSNGVNLPFSEVATLSSSRSPSSIIRIDRQRTVNVRADVDKDNADIEAIKRDLRLQMAELASLYPDIHFSLEGESREQEDSFNSLKWGLLGVLFLIYALLAIPFRSYWQPLIVMSVIPFGIAGAIIGHWIMGMSLTIMSFMGMLALIGVVVNDSLVLVDYINQQRNKGVGLLDAVKRAGVIRFRPVLLTSLTTFCGLMPLIFEKSTQAQFLIPMAVSLGFGILFATFITLLLVPVNYLLLEGAMRRAKAGKHWWQNLGKNPSQ